MIINKKGQAFEFEGLKYVIGEKIITTAASDYDGLFGVITEIRDGADKETENERTHRPGGAFRVYYH